MASKRLAMIKVCPACLQDFRPFSKGQVFCSRACKGDTSTTLICTTCGKEYKKSGSVASRVKHNNYCSIACKFAGKRVVIECAGCGTSFDRIQSWLSDDKTNYCSLACAHQGLKVVKPILTCAFCEAQFERYPSEIRKMSERGYRHVFCSHKCRAAMIAAQFDPPRPYTGPHTSAPRNGVKIQAWRKAVFERDNFTCQECGAADVLLTAHHIKAYALYPALRHEPSNGVTLCYPCHERRHSLH